ncbi:MAG: hypothetical protein C0600_05125 [Ignavibacteria bacterium]|nr:MAG: hypothetical protein C0600_05125 [Ignavibacteria bacterium]
MKHTRVFFLAVLSALVFIGISCSEDDPTGPNDLGGDPNLELTNVGQKFPVSVSVPGTSSVLRELGDSIVITENDGGIVTMHAVFTFDTAFVRGLQEELGISALPETMKRSILDTYVDRYGGVIDSTDRDAITLTAGAKLKITSEGIQEYISSKGDLSRPFTVVKYDMNVGDSWNFTDDDGVTITRTVTSKSTTDDYEVGFWMLKVIKVEETKEDPLLEKITYVTNHKYGLVGMHYQTKTGQEIDVTVFPPTL